MHVQQGLKIFSEKTAAKVGHFNYFLFEAEQPVMSQGELHACTISMAGSFAKEATAAFLKMIDTDPLIHSICIAVLSQMGCIS